MTAVLSSSPPAGYAGHLSNGNPTQLAKVYKPTHPGVFEVKFEEGEYNSSLVALRDFQKGETLATMDAARDSTEVRYSTVQVAENRHIELNSDLLYCNHSCNPSVIFNVSEGSSPREWKAVAWRDIKKGDILTFFYPSTEWSMTQVFNCACGEAQCLGTISGAKDVPADLIFGNSPRYFVNAHIRKRKEEQVQAQQ